MPGLIGGIDREQAVLFPARLDGWSGEDDLVHLVDLFVDELDLPALGFARSAPAQTGRSGYHPAVLLTLFIYGYLNRILSSCRLEREARRIVELMWLIGRLVPDRKTIADIRRDNGPAIRWICSQVVELCRRIGTLKGESVAVDGSKFRAVNTEALNATGPSDRPNDRHFTNGRIASRIAHLDADVERTIQEMVRAERREEGEARADQVAHLDRRYGRVKPEIEWLKAMDKALADAPDGQVLMPAPWRFNRSSVLEPSHLSQSNRPKGLSRTRAVAMNKGPSCDAGFPSQSCTNGAAPPRQEP